MLRQKSPYDIIRNKDMLDERTTAVTATTAAIAFAVTAALPGCFLVKKKTEAADEREYFGADGGDSGAQSNNSVLAKPSEDTTQGGGKHAADTDSGSDTANRDSGSAGPSEDATQGNSMHAAETDSGGDTAIAESDIGLEGVEICLEKRITTLIERQSTLTDRQGRYRFEDSFDDSPEEDGLSFTLSAVKLGFKIEPKEIQLEVDEVLSGGVVSGFVAEDFAIRRINTGPHAEGRWKVVEYICPTGFFLDVCDEQSDEVCPADVLCSDPDSKIGNEYTFVNGCLFDDPGKINCVDGEQYTAGSTICRVGTWTLDMPGYDTINWGGDYLGSPSYSKGYFDKDTQRWHIIEYRPLTHSSTTFPFEAELVLERVSSSDGGQS